MLKGQIFN